MKGVHMATLKLSAEELKIIREEETAFMVDSLAKDKTVTLLRPSDKKRVLTTDQATYNMIVDIIEVLIPVANRNGTPLTLNLISSALGVPASTLSDLFNSNHTATMNASELEWHEKIVNYLRDTLSIAKTDVESLQLGRRIDSTSAAKVIHDLEALLEEQSEYSAPTTVTIINDISEH